MTDRITPASTQQNAAHSTLLIVDDQPENLEVLSKILRPTYRVRAARSGEQALQAAAREPKPDLILLDVTMPGMDGFDVLEQLHGDTSLRDIPVIFVTARDAAEDEQHGFEKGAVDYIAKPIRPAVVLARVRTHLEIKHARDRLRTQNDWLEAEVDRRVRENLLIKEEKERIELQLIQAQKLEAIGTLAGGIAHDFNNILSPILGYAEMALEETPESSSARDCLHQVLAATRRARDLVKQILSFSRMGDEEQMHPTEIGLIVKEALKLLRASLPSTVQITSDIQKGRALANATQVHQVLVNLCTNAVHAMGDKGLLNVSLVRTQVEEHTASGLSAADPEPGQYLKLGVSDTGHGMDSQTVQRIFEPYFTTKEVGKGTGLGLSVVHGIVKRHGGWIIVRSEVGKGSLFEVYLPMIADKPAVYDEPSDALPGGTERILLVDDEPVIAELGARVLERMGYRVIKSTQPREACDYLLTNPETVDLVITDYTMPDMTGIELAEAVHRVRTDMPIVICTGFSEQLSEEAAKAVGIAKICLKPMNRRDWALAVREALVQGTE